jgi:hypothetical protein
MVFEEDLLRRSEEIDKALLTRLARNFLAAVQLAAVVAGSRRPSLSETLR